MHYKDLQAISLNHCGQAPTVLGARLRVNETLIRVSAAIGCGDYLSGSMTSPEAASVIDCAAANVPGERYVFELNHDNPPSFGKEVPASQTSSATLTVVTLASSVCSVSSAGLRSPLSLYRSRSNLVALAFLLEAFTELAR